MTFHVCFCVGSPGRDTKQTRMSALDNNQLLGDKPLESGHNLKQNKIK